MPKDPQLKQLGKLARTCKRRTTNIQSLNIWEPKKKNYQFKILETITKSCKYHSKCESAENVLDTKPWKRYRNNNLAAEKNIKITRSHCGRRDLVFLNTEGFMSGSENFTCGLEGFISGFCTVSCQVSVRLHLGLCALSIGPYGFNEDVLGFHCGVFGVT